MYHDKQSDPTSTLYLGNFSELEKNPKVGIVFEILLVICSEVVLNTKKVCYLLKVWTNAVSEIAPRLCSSP
jgi:hypothetical protein